MSINTRVIDGFDPPEDTIINATGKDREKILDLIRRKLDQATGQEEEIDGYE